MTARRASQQQLPVSDRPRVHKAAIGSLLSGLLGILLALTDFILVYREYSGMASKGDIDHGIFGFSSMIVSLLAIVFGIQALYAAHQEPRWRTGNGLALAGLVLGSLPVIYYGFLISLLFPYLLIIEGGSLVIILMVCLLKLARRALRSHPYQLDQ